MTLCLIMTEVVESKGDGNPHRQVIVSNQENMLAKIQKALGRNPESPPPTAPSVSGDAGMVSPPTAANELLARFEAELQTVGGRTFRAGSSTELDHILLSILDAHAATQVVLSKNPILGQTKLREKCASWGKSAARWSGSSMEEEGRFRQQCFAADVGITGVSFVLAESGSLVLTSQTEGAQLVSLAPPVHIALYQRNQLRATLEDVLSRLPVSTVPGQPGPARSAVFVTGTSRTADIEQILIRGVHGPREVHAILIEEACLIGE